MSWEVAIILDPNYDPFAADSLSSDMPICDCRYSFQSGVRRKGARSIKGALAT